MVSVFRLKIDATSCQWVVPCDTTFISSGGLRFDGTSRQSAWNPPEFYIHNPIGPKTHFYVIGAGTFACDREVLRQCDMETYFEMAGELLPISLESGESLYIFNVTEVVNALDREHVQFRKNPVTHNPVAIENYALHPYRFGESSIFKIPETCRSEILTYSGRSRNPEEEFIHAYQASGLTGLKFVELWRG